MAAMYMMERMGTSSFLHHVGCELANEHKLIHSVNHLLRSYYILGFVVAVEYTKDYKTDEASALMELIL